MAQPSFTPVSAGDALDAATWNSLFSSMVTQSSNIHAVNVRDEGLDRHVIDTGTVVSVHEQIDNDSATAYSYGLAGGPDVLAGSFVQVSHGTPLRVTNSGAGWTFDPTTQTAEVEASLQIRRVYKSQAPSFQLWYQPTGGGPTALPYTYRPIWYAGPAGAGNDYQTFSLTIKSTLYTAGTYDWIELRTFAETGTFLNAGEWYYLSEGSIAITIMER